MRFDRRRFVAATLAASTCSLASAQKPNVALAGASINFEEAGGSVDNTGDKNRRAYDRAIVQLTRQGGGSLFVPPKQYPFSGESAVVGNNVTVLAAGATFKGLNCRITIPAGSSAYGIHGLKMVETSASASSFLLNCGGSNCHFKDMHLEKSPPAGGYIAYCQQNTSGNLFENFSFAGSNGVFVGGRNHEVRGGWAESSGGDDCWVLKATVAPCDNFRISGFRAKGFAALLSIGSEIGTSGVDNPSRNLYVRNVSVEGCSATECTYFAYIKPGGVEGGPAYDYRDGLVEDIAISNCTIEDSTGQRFRNALYVSPGRGAVVRRLNISNLTVRARGRSPAVQNIAPIFINVLGYLNGAGTGGSVEEVVIQGLNCVDPHGGLARSDTVPGDPIHMEVAIEKLNSSVGHIGKVEVHGAQTNGCARMAIFVGANVTGPIRVLNSTFDNFAAAVMASSDAKAVVAHSPVVELQNVTATPAPSAPPGTTGLP